jgi:hypothetical protein
MLEVLADAVGVKLTHLKRRGEVILTFPLNGEGKKSFSLRLSKKKANSLLFWIYLKTKKDEEVCDG